MIDARYAALGVLSADGSQLARFVTSGMSDEERDRLGEHPIGKGILGLLMRNPTPLRLEDLTQHPEAAGFPPSHPPMHSFLGVPIIGREGPIAYMAASFGAFRFPTFR